MSTLCHKWYPPTECFPLWTKPIPVLSPDSTFPIMLPHIPRPVESNVVIYVIAISLLGMGVEHVLSVNRGREQLLVSTDADQLTSSYCVFRYK